MAKATSKNKRREAPTRQLAAIPAAELAAELRRRERQVRMLVRRYETLMGRAAKLRQEIETLGGTIGRSASRLSSGSSGMRPRNKSNLVDALKSVFAGKTLSVGDAAQKVIEAGYRSTSPAFRQIVNLTLSKSDQFERVGRGLYKAK